MSHPEKAIADIIDLIGGLPVLGILHVRLFPSM
jgi:hypothetical protein